MFIAKFSKEQRKSLHPQFVLAQLTSKLLSYYFRYKANEFDALFPKIKIGEFKLLSVTKENDKAQSDLVNLSNAMLELNDSFFYLDTKIQNYLISESSVVLLTEKLKFWNTLAFEEIRFH